MEQTNRTILFEEINPGKEDLFSLIGDVKNKQSLTDEEVITINQKLLVRSFEEFLNKYNPGLYGTVDMNELTFGVSKENLWRNSNTFHIRIGKSMPFFQTLFQLLDLESKDRTIDNHIAKKLVDILEKAKVLELKETLKKVKEEYLFGDIENAQLLLEHIVNAYDKGVVLLRVILDGLQKQIEEVKINKTNPMIIKDVNNTQIDIVKMSKKFKEYEFSIEKEQKDAYRQFVGSFFEKCKAQGKIICNEEAMQICLEMAAYTDNDIAYMLDRYHIYQELYQNIILALWGEMRPLLQNILGIYTFFEQYGMQDNVVGGMPPSILIANCMPESLQTPDNSNRLKVYLDTINNKVFNQDALWYAIIPTIEYQKDNAQDKIRERFRSRDTERRGLFNKELTHSQECISELLGILTEYQVICFISIVGKKSTAFPQFEKEGLDNYNRTFYGVINSGYSEFIIPCIPNFTIVSREYMDIELGNIYAYDEFVDEEIKSTGTYRVWLEGIYVEASYVAAGLVAAWQCPNYLKRYYKNRVAMDLPGTAYRIMEADHRYITKTTMLREIIGYNDELKSDIENHSIGVVFMPTSQGIVMATDRCASYQNGTFDSISTIQTLVYMERVIRHETQDFKNTLIKLFFQNRPGSIRAKWSENNANVNTILKEKENITYQLNEGENTCVFDVTFNELNKNKKVMTSS